MEFTVEKWYNEKKCIVFANVGEYDIVIMAAKKGAADTTVTLLMLVKLPA